SLTATDGCGTGSLYTVLRGADDADVDPSNGTPHAGAIYAPLARHKIACGTAGDAANQNVSDGCPSFSPDPPALQEQFCIVPWPPLWLSGKGAYRLFYAFINGCYRFICVYNKNILDN
nr:hypothetical protein [Deltaproteobacteria bacterium]